MKMLGYRILAFPSLLQRQTRGFAVAPARSAQTKLATAHNPARNDTFALGKRKKGI